MKVLIVEDELFSRILMQDIFNSCPEGIVHVAVNGREAVDAFTIAHAEGSPYDLICLDIMMPEMNGQAALKEIRRLEEEMHLHGQDAVKVFMTTAVDDQENIMASSKGRCEVYMVKPINRIKLLEQVRNLGLMDCLPRPADRVGPR